MCFGNEKVKLFAGLGVLLLLLTWLRSLLGKDEGVETFWDVANPAGD